MQRAWSHLAFWTAYVLFKTYLNVADNDQITVQNFGLALGAQLVMLPVKVPLVYFCFLTLDKYLDRTWKPAVGLIALAGAFSLGVLSMTLLNHAVILPYFHGLTTTISMLDTGSLLYHFFTLAFVTGIACTIHLFRRQFRSRLRETELQREKIETELKYLKGQINPHFLFNTLNNIYALARKGSEQTAESIMKLSKLMRFMLYEAGHPTILLTEELKLMQDYIALEKLRYNDQLVVTYKESIDNPNQHIAPLLLIHFVENAFKHGTSESRQAPYINIDIALRNHMLQVSIANSRGPGYQQGAALPIGMTNIRRQLELLYPNHDLAIDHQSDRFSVNLRIPLPT